LPASRLQQWAAYPLLSKVNEITSVLQMPVTNQQGSIKKIFPLKLKIRAVCVRFSHLETMHTVSSQFRIAVCKCLFLNPVPRFFKFNRPKDLNFNTNKRQEALFNFGVKKSHIEGVCEATNNDSSTSSLQSNLQDVQKEGETTGTQKKTSAFTREYMGSYLKFGFIQCPDTDQLPRPQCVICATVLGNEAMKLSRLIRRLNTKHSDLVNKPIEFFMRKRGALKIEKKIISQVSTTDISLLTESYSV